MAICTDCLPEGWEAVGQTCDSIPILVDAVENVCEALCNLRCEISRIVETDDCDMEPEDFFPALFPDCLELPDGAIVIQNCGCTNGGVRIWFWDELPSVWRQLGRDFAIGDEDDFVDDNDPTDAELNALFDEARNVNMLALISSTGVFWYSSDCGLNWDAVGAGGGVIDSDVQQTGDMVWYQNGPTSGWQVYFNEVIYTNGSSASMPIQTGDLIDITVDFGYIITQFAYATNPQDIARFRIQLSGPFPTYTVEYGHQGPPPNTLPTEVIIRNGFDKTFNIKKKATKVGNLTCKISAEMGGTQPNDDGADWKWILHVHHTSVSVQRS